METHMENFKVALADLRDAGLTWDDLSQGDKGLFEGVAQGWWEAVDIKRRAPIPFPKVFNIKDAPKHWTMAHALVKLGLFPSLSEARQWKKPLVTGEFFLFKRTERMLLIHVTEALETED